MDIAERLDDGNVIREFQLDAGYYRLAYQLVAQQIHAAFAEDGEIPIPTERGPLDSLDEVVTTANVVASQARRVLASFADRERRAGWWHPRLRLQPKELRLKRFLDCTIVPCLELAIAGIFAWKGDIGMAEHHKGLATEHSHFSYRAFYNYACFETAMGIALRSVQADDSHVHFRLAIDYLQLAFARVQGRQRDDIVRWAQDDPSLASLHTDDSDAKSNFERLILRYNPVTSNDAYYVRADDTDWIVVRAGNVLGRSSTKDGAITLARQIARANTPSDLIINRRDGSEEERRHYGGDEDETTAASS